MRPRHSDSDLLALAREGSAPAFASLLHRHRDVIQRGALRAEHPERAAEAVMVGALRGLPHATGPAADLRAWLSGHVDAAVDRDPGSPGVERMLPTDWFDRTWVRVEERWPSGRRPLHLPRWAAVLVGAVLLAATGAVATYLSLTADATGDVLSVLVAEPIEDPEMLVVPGPVVVAEPEQAPELFGDVELGELPDYDLSGDGGAAPGPSFAPRPTPPSAEGGTTDPQATDDEVNPGDRADAPQR